MLKFLNLVLGILSGLLQYINRFKAEQAGRLAAQIESIEIIERKEADAKAIRVDADDIDDIFLLPPAERGAGRVQSLSANLRSGPAGVAAGAASFGSQPDQGTQRDMGEELFTRPKREVRKVYLHCSASDLPEHDDVKVIDQWHKARGWSEIGYHYYINKKGQVFKGRNLEKIPAAQYGYNRGTIAICCGGCNYFSEEQMLSLKALCFRIDVAYQGEVTFHGHCEVSAKTCPNFDYRNILGLNEKGKLA